jgi:hypothetical protein
MYLILVQWGRYWGLKTRSCTHCVGTLSLSYTPNPEFNSLGISMFTLFKLVKAQKYIKFYL